MNGAYAHLVLNHFPILGTLFGLVLLAVAILRKSQELQRAALVTFVAVGILTIPAYLSGHAAEEIVEEYPGMSEEAIEAMEEHEDAGLFLILAVEILAAASIVGVVAGGRAGVVPRKLAIACLLIAIFTMTVAMRTAHLGRDIRHPEAASSPAP